jgi:hypothetical protein
MLKPVVGYENRYLATDRGRVWSMQTMKFLRPIKQRRGYQSVSLCRDGKAKTFLLHRVIAAAFLGPCPPSYQVNHVNAKKSDNRPCNLEYVTFQANRRHAAALGLAGGGHRKGNRMTLAWALAIKRLRQEAGWSITAVAGHFGLTRYRVQHILSLDFPAQKPLPVYEGAGGQSANAVA